MLFLNLTTVSLSAITILFHVAFMFSLYRKLNRMRHQFMLAPETTIKTLDLVIIITNERLSLNNKRINLINESII